MPASPDTLLPAVTRLAEGAGTAILEIYNTDFEVSEKADTSPLTAADLAAHRHIVAGLHEITPGIPILSEESNAIAFSERSRWGRYWLVDPLDGTKEFVKRNGEFTVNIALIDEHRPVLGVVHAPVLGLTYRAAADTGSFRDDLPHNERLIPIRTSPVQTPPRVIGSRSHGSSGMAAFLEAVGEHTLESIGSSLKFCRVAEGQADVYPRFGPTSEWDTAAAQCVVEQAGGAVIDLKGRELRYNTRDSILNPYFLVCGDPAGGWIDKVPASLGEVS